MPEGKHPINLTLTIEQPSLKKIVEEGRLMEFVDALSTLAAAHIKSEIIDHLVRARAGSVSIAVGFDDDNKYGTGPHGPHWPWPHRGVWEDVMRELTVEEVTSRMTSKVSGGR